MKKRKFASGGTSALDDLASGEMEGSFSNRNKDIYARARDVVASRLNEGTGEEQPAKASVKRARKAEEAPAPKPAEPAAERTSDTSKRFRGSKAEPEEAPTKRAEIPTSADGPKAPASTGESTSGPSNLDRILVATGAGAGLTGAAALAKRAYNATRPADRIAKAIESVKVGSKSTTPIVQSAKSAEKYSPKQQLEAGESALRGATNRARLKNLREELDMSGAGMKKGGTVKKYASGGMVGSASRRADGIATKGKTKCRIV